MTIALSPQQVAELKESFDTFDRNGDGTISRRELHSLLYTVGHKTKTDDILSEYDVDNSGTIDFEEFLKLVDVLIKNKVEGN
ncbi:hypothetical protein BG011_009075 [Mortierella polycephala]|uniref:EF-hand domain-containing protein n=1 Tax=Mortierella polycephala TaxID=41804 RepID=A0A9P6QAW1_9FUNG|nr:hypothetical protein BG011_009075 [Mortierella polycephala]